MRSSLKGCLRRSNCNINNYDFIKRCIHAADCYHCLNSSAKALTAHSCCVGKGNNIDGKWVKLILMTCYCCRVEDNHKGMALVWSALSRVLLLFLWTNLDICLKGKNHEWGIFLLCLPCWMSDWWVQCVHCLVNVDGFLLTVIVSIVHQIALMVIPTVFVFTTVVIIVV